jgi:glutamyl-tRNA synthetase
MAARQVVGYDGTCRHLSAGQIAANEAAGLPFVIRFKVPQRAGMLGYDDKVLGRIEQNYAEIEDFVIVRSNGKPLYLLCNVVDDIRDRITHILRGQDHMTNTLRQVLLYEALDAPLPVFAHMPLTLDLKKAKISKRSHGEIVAVQFYKEHGFIPWALSNFLVLLGWSSGTDKEFFSREELIEAFTLERINKSNSIFNYRKGDEKFFTDPKAIAINEHYLRTMDINEIGAMAQKVLEREGLWDAAYGGERRQWYLQTLDLIRDRFHTINDFATLGRAYFGDDFVVEEKPLTKNLLKFPELHQWLPELAHRYQALPQFTAEETERVAKELAEEKGVKAGIIVNGMRTVVTGQLAGPSMYDILLTLGRETVVRRLRDVDKFFQ